MSYTFLLADAACNQLEEAGWNQVWEKGCVMVIHNVHVMQRTVAAQAA